MLDLQRCNLLNARIDEAKVASGSTVSQEGKILVSALGSDGEEYVTESAGLVNTEKFAGISYSCTLSPTQFPNVETGTIPAATAYTIQLVKTNLVGSGATGQIRVYNVTDSVEMANDTAINPANPDSTKFAVNYTTGLVYFNVLQASDSVLIYYQYQPTTLEATTRWFQANINVNSAAVFNQVGVIKPPFVIYTSEYDASIDWSDATATANIKTGVAGVFEGDVGTSGAVLGNARVVHVPDTDNVYLGIEMLALA